MITQSEAPAPELILVDKLWTDLSFNYRLTEETRASVTQEKLIPRKKRDIKSLATSPPIKYPIPNQDKNNLGLQKYQCLRPNVLLFSSVFESLRNEVSGDNTETTDTSRNDKENMSCNNWDDSIENVKAMKNKNYDGEYKEDNSQHQHGNKNIIKKTK